MKPRLNLVLVEMLEETEEKQSPVSGLYIPNSTKMSNFIKLKVIEVGPHVKDIKKGDVVLAEDMFAPIQKGGKIGLILDDYIKVIE